MKLAGGDFLSGAIGVERGSIRDYRELAHLHYAPGDPAIVCGVWRAVWTSSEQSAVGSGQGEKRCSLLHTVHCALPTVSHAAHCALPAARVIGVAVLSF